MTDYSQINWLIDEVPAEDREVVCQMSGIRIDNITGYHVTRKENVDSIRKNGIKATTIQTRNYERKEATYFFMAKFEIDDQMAAVILGENVEYEVVEFVIPRSEFLSKAKWDGLHNVSFGTATAVQFYSDIKADWIV